jgi:MYXO-CTERM domain-containing protein
MRLPASILVFASLALFAGEVRAHIKLTSPQPRTESQKQGPCGAGPGDLRGPTVATFKPGEKIVVTWNEFVNHPGHYRIALDEDGQDGFFDPKDFDDMSGGPGVIIDGIADQQGGDYAQEITLPDVECDNCVLQVIQVMTDKPPYSDGNDLYYQCADIAIVGEVASTDSGEPGTTGAPGTTGGSSDATGSTGEPGSSDPSGGATDPTGGAPTTGTADSSTGAATGSTVTAGATDGTGGTGDGTTDGADKDSGCGCRSGDAGGLAWLTVGLLPLLRRRRRG